LSIGKGSVILVRGR